MKKQSAPATPSLPHIRVSLPLQFLLMTLIVIAITVLIVPFRPVIGVTQFSVLYLPVILICALVAHPSVTFFAGLISFICFDLFVVPPQFPFSVNSFLDLLNPLSVLVVAIVTGVITERARRRSVQVAVYRDADKLRTTLLNLVSHNLRTPLATIKTALTAMETDAALSESSQQLLADANAASDRVNRLVANILRLSQLETDKLKVQLQPYAIDDLIEVTLERWSSATASGDLVAQMPATLPLVMIDSDLIGAVLTNLIENALRHGKPPVIIHVQPRPDDLLVTVQDAGAGVPAERRSSLFTPFSSSRPTGIGLGLAVCKGLVEAHGGKLWATFDDATCFHFTLPLESATESAG
ncbi:MAG: PAS domain-containing sensor histidine kinase [Anaerolineae bacterium]|nr:PAS domain-containing sensor histidine kinase [Anaerolineae bacterium]